MRGLQMTRRRDRASEEHCGDERQGQIEARIAFEAARKNCGWAAEVKDVMRLLHPRPQGGHFDECLRKASLPHGAFVYGRRQLFKAINCHLVVSMCDDQRPRIDGCALSVQLPALPALIEGV